MKWKQSSLESRSYIAIKRLEKSSVISQIGGLIADGIVTSMKKREPFLLENKFLLAALYVDVSMPRMVLNEDQLSKGKDVRLKVVLLQDEEEQAARYH